MKINFYATLRLAAETKTLEIEISQGKRILDIVNEVVWLYPALRVHLLDEAGLLNGHIHIFVNSKDVTYLPDGMNSILQPEDTIDLFPPVGGGS